MRKPWRRVWLGLIGGGAFLAAGCATPAHIVEKSRANAELYAQTERAYALFVAAMEADLRARAELEARLAVAAGDSEPSFTREQASEPDPAVQAMAAFETYLEILRAQYAAVDRYLRVGVVDPREVSEVTRRARLLTSGEAAAPEGE